MLRVTDTRVYVHETLTLLTDIDLDGEFTVQYGVSRVNFYEQLDYYDLDDFDRDGYLNDDDAFPTDETEWADVNGNGIGDNIDPEGDKDGDGVTNPEDAFPEDPAASQDSDGDGYPDSWNEDATEQMIADSNLTLDAFPYDANEAIDSDLDGIGNNADTDDDNDGLSDIDEIATELIPSIATAMAMAPPMVLTTYPWTTAIIGIPTATELAILPITTTTTTGYSIPRICSHGQRTTAVFWRRI